MILLHFYYMGWLGVHEWESFEQIFRCLGSWEDDIRDQEARDGVAFAFLATCDLVGDHALLVWPCPEMAAVLLGTTDVRWQLCLSWPCD